MMKHIPLSVPEIKGNEWKYVKDCLDTGWVSSAGKYVERFERALAGYVGAKYAVACVNGTSALHTALIEAGVGPGDEVIVPALTFIAPAYAVRYCGAFPVFMDAEENYWQIDPQKLKDFLTTQCVRYAQGLVNKQTKRVIKAIVPVHLLGHPCDMDAVMALARKFDLFVVEDASQSVGSMYKGCPVGNIGHIGCFSFNGNKIITCGGGGMLTTNRKQWARHMRYLTTQAKDDPLEYIHHETGYNYRLTNVQAALGLAQWERLEDSIAVKKKIGERYAKGLQGMPGVILPAQAPWAQAYHWLYTIRIDARKFGHDCRSVLRSLAKVGIQSRPLWHPLDTLKPFKSCCSYQVRVAYQLYRQALSLPSSVSLTASQQHYIINQIKKI